MSEFNLGDKVVLRPETKPYTFKGVDELTVLKEVQMYDDKLYEVRSVNYDGDVTIVCDGIQPSSISAHHLKHAKEDTAFEDYHKKLYQQYSDSFNDLESDVKAELEKLKDIDIVELRLSIFKAKPNRTLEEMQAIEDWLLGEK